MPSPSSSSSSESLMSSTPHLLFPLPIPSPCPPGRRTLVSSFLLLPSSHWAPWPKAPSQQLTVSRRLSLLFKETHRLPQSHFVCLIWASVWSTFHRFRLSYWLAYSPCAELSPFLENSIRLLDWISNGKIGVLTATYETGLRPLPFPAALFPFSCFIYFLAF